MIDEDDANPFELCERAAKGDLEAQRFLAAGAADCLQDGAISGFYEGLTYARMAAAHGNAEDTGLLLCLLGLASQLLGPENEGARLALAGEALARAQVESERMTGKDAEDFDAVMTLAIEQSSPAEVIASKEYQDLMRAAKAKGE